MAGEGYVGMSLPNRCLKASRLYIIQLSIISYTACTTASICFDVRVRWPAKASFAANTMVQTLVEEVFGFNTTDGYGAGTVDGMHLDRVYM